MFCDDLCWWLFISSLFFVLSFFFFCVYCVVVCSLCVFFFFKQKTAYEMRISDWSSDVCSSDLIGAHIFYRWPGSWGKPRAFSDAYAGAEFIPAFSHLYQGGGAAAEALPGEVIAAAAAP